MALDFRLNVRKNYSSGDDARWFFVCTCAARDSRTNWPRSWITFQ